MWKKGGEERRAPFPALPSRAGKLLAGRTTATQTALSIRVSDVELDEPLREYVRQRLGFALGKFAIRIRRVSVRLINQSGPKATPTIACRIKVMLDPTNDVFVEHVEDDLRPAIDGAFDRAERGVRRALQKMRARRRP